MKYKRLISLGFVFLVVLFFLLFFFLTEKSDSLFVLQSGDKELIQHPAEVKKEDLEILFGGDIMLSRTVNAKMEKYQDYAWPFRKIGALTSSSPLAIFNLESPFLENSEYDVPSGSFSFRANPKAVSGLVFAGVDAVSLANNHILNAGQKGLSDTMMILDKAGIMYSGAGMNELDARKPAILTSGNWRVALLSYAYPEDNSLAFSERAGIAGMNKEKMTADVKSAADLADLVIVMMHAGQEYSSLPDARQKNFAQAAIDAGADAVIGHHPHWPQSFEVYRDKPIIYSLGNFVFDQMWSKETSRGLLASLSFRADGGGNASFLPITINDYGQAQIWPDSVPLFDFWHDYGLPESKGFAWPGI